MTCNHEWYIYKILWANYKDKNDKHQFDLFYEQRQDVEKKDVKSDDKKSVIILDQQNLVLITSSSNVSIYHENVGCTQIIKVWWVVFLLYKPNKQNEIDYKNKQRPLNVI